MSLYLIHRLAIYLAGILVGFLGGYMVFGEDRVAGEIDNDDDLFVLTKMNQKSMNHGASVVDMDDPLNIDLGN